MKLIVIYNNLGYNDVMGRPKGSKDKVPRAKRNDFGFSRADGDMVRTFVHDGHTDREIAILTSLSDDQVKAIRADFHIKRFDSRILADKPLLSLNCQASKNKKCGIYVIVIYRSDNRGARYYIGSSTDAEYRCYRHNSELRCDRHFNTQMQYEFKTCVKHEFRLLEECDEEILLELESKYISRHSGLYNRCNGVYNGWINRDEQTSIRDVLSKITEKMLCKGMEITESGCWEFRTMRKNGYGCDIQVRHNGTVYYIKPHRASIYFFKGEYPGLVRHLCHNKRCINPIHLSGGSHRENSADQGSLGNT